MMVMVVEGDDDARHYLERVAERHGEADLDIPATMYDLWLDSLVRAVSERDPEWSDGTEALWRKMMSQGIEMMRSYQ